MQQIKRCEYKDLKDIGMLWVCKCVDCREFFLGIKHDWVCGECSDKPELDNERSRAWKKLDQS